MSIELVLVVIFFCILYILYDNKFHLREMINESEIKKGREKNRIEK